MLRAIAIAALLGACGSRPAKPPIEGDDLDVEARRPTLYDRVPADTPYALAIAKPATTPSLEATLAALQRAAALLRQRPHEQGDELGAPLDFARIAAAGVDLQRPLIVYGLGLYPAVQVSVADLGRLEPAVDEALGTLGARRDKLGERSRWTLGVGGSSLVVIAGPRRLGAALIPTPLVAALSPVIAGERRPARSIAATLGELSRRYQVSGRVGFVDVPGVARAIVGVEPFEVAGVDIPAAFDAAGGTGIPRACRRGLVDLSREIPRVIYGLRGERAGGERLALIVELGRATRERLAAMATTMPAVDPALLARAQLAVSVGVRHRPMMNMLADGLDAIAAVPGCNLEGEVAAPRDWLRRSGRVNAGIAGAVLAITAISDQPGDPLERLSGVIAGGIDAPGPFRAAIAPLLGQLPRGKAVRIGERAFAASAGLEGTALVDAIAAAPPIRGPLLSVALRGELARDLQTRDPDPELEAAAPELARQLAELVTPVRFRSLTAELSAIQSGVEAAIEIEFAEQ